jgi:hypothetical protein
VSSTRQWSFPMVFADILHGPNCTIKGRFDLVNHRDFLLLVLVLPTTRGLLILVRDFNGEKVAGSYRGYVENIAVMRLFIAAELVITTN